MAGSSPPPPRRRAQDLLEKQAFPEACSTIRRERLARVVAEDRHEPTPARFGSGSSGSVSSRASARGLGNRSCTSGRANATTRSGRSRELEQRGFEERRPTGGRPSGDSPARSAAAHSRPSLSTKSSNASRICPPPSSLRLASRGSAQLPLVWARLEPHRLSQEERDAVLFGSVRGCVRRAREASGTAPGPGLAVDDAGGALPNSCDEEREWRPGGDRYVGARTPDLDSLLARRDRASGIRGAAATRPRLRTRSRATRARRPPRRCTPSR